MCRLKIVAKTLAPLCFAAICLSIRSEEAFFTSDGGFGLLPLDVTFKPKIATLGWKGMSEVESTGTNAAGEVAFTMTFPDSAKVFDGEVHMKARKDGRLAVRWTILPRCDMRVQECYVVANLPCSTYAGGHLEVDGDTLPLSLELHEPFTSFVRTASRMSFFDAHGRQTFALTFPKSRHVVVQDMRRFSCGWFDLRLEGPADLKSGHDEVIDFAMELPDDERVAVRPFGKFVPSEDDRWLPVRLSSRIEPGSAADFSPLRGNAGLPAGAYGSLVVRDGHFEFERLPGVIQRFYGINLCYDNCYPRDAEAAEDLTALIAACGYNAIRLHLYDRDLTTDGLTPKPGWLERMDTLLAAAIRHGLYVTTDLYCQRGGAIPKASVGLEGNGNLGDIKWLLHFHEGVFSNQVEFVRMFLGHRNALTGWRYAEEPALCLISLVNEGMLAYLKTPSRESIGYDVANVLWREWLARNRARFPGVADDLPERSDAYGSDPVKVAMREFYAEREGLFAERMKRLLREELGSRALLSSLNCGDVPVEYANFRKRCFDYTDSHFYWDHPHFLKGPWWVPTRAGHDSGNPLCSVGRGQESGVRFAGQPLTWTEFHYCVPGRFRALSGLLTGVNAAYNGWDGAWRFCWGDDRGAAADQATRPILSWFSVANDPMSLASERAVAALYLRGDFKKGSRAFGDGDGLDIDRVDGSITVETPRTCGGFRMRGAMNAGDLQVDLGSDSGAIWVSSLSEEPIVTSSRLLLTHLTDGMDTGMVFSDPRRIVMESYGRHPHLLRRGRARISLRLASGDWGVYSLDSSGIRHSRIPVNYNAGRLAFTIDVACRKDDATFLYEIVK